MTKDFEATWKQALTLLKDNVNNQTYQTWIEPISFVEANEKSVVLGVPNKFFKNWVEEHYLGPITSTLEKVSNKKFALEFIIVSEAALKPAAGRGEEAAKDKPAAGQAQEKAAEEKKQGFSFFFKKNLPTEESRLNPKYTFDSFVVGPSNRFAHAAALAVSESPAKAYNPLFIYGKVGLGKTHLMQAIGHYILQKKPSLKFIYISSEKFTNQLISAIQNRTTLKFREMYRNVDLLLIDDIHFIAGKESTQEEFFHTFNALYDAHKQIVVSSDRSPKDIPSLEERLVSRFEWGLVTDIQPPDIETRIAILRNKAERETISIPDDVTYFIAESVRSNIRELEGALIRVVAYAKLVGKEINLDLVKEVLKDVLIEQNKKITIDSIQQKVAQYFDIRLADMRSKKRNKAIAYPRQIAMYLSRDLTDFSLPEIGEQFGGRDHSTVMHACEKVYKDMESKNGVREMVNKISGNITGSS
ncbi:MAG: chromosomal replication initiator protein DnaA [Candidatus Omnitrophica bacterium]|nr:chromosomal replication initiator protein DnaA [Candidatus Omnitrophota bacterium]